jgi:hypothetical protein
MPVTYAFERRSTATPTVVLVQWQHEPAGDVHQQAGSGEHGGQDDQRPELGDVEVPAPREAWHTPASQRPRRTRRSSGGAGATGAKSGSKAMAAIVAAPRRRHKTR